jgi:hypothetical protein
MLPQKAISLLMVALVFISMVAFFCVGLGEGGPEGGFSISVSPPLQAALPGESVSYQLHISASDPDPPVTLNVSGLPVGVTSLFAHNPVSPNGTTTLTLTMLASTQRGTYALEINAVRGNLTHTANVTLVVAVLSGQVAQTRTDTITFSWSKTLEKSQGFSAGGVSMSVSARFAVSLNMPLYVKATSNESFTEAGSAPWIVVSMSSGSAQITADLYARASVGSTTESNTQTWTRSFTTPLGVSSEITFPKIQIPAIDAGIGQVTLDLTPKVSLVGSVRANFTASGPCTISKKSIEWKTSGTEGVILTTLNEKEEAEVRLSSPILTIDQFLIGTNIGATLKTLWGSQDSFDLGALQMPLQTAIPLVGAPVSTVVAEYLLPTPPIPVFISGSTDITESSIRIGWTENTERDFKNYTVYQSQIEGSIGDPIWTTTDRKATSLNVTGLSPKTAYYFTVRTFDTTDLYSDSEQFTGTTVIPLQPINLYWVLAIVGGLVATGAIGGIGISRRRRQTQKVKKAVAAASTLRSAEEGSLSLVTSNDYSTGALCFVDSYPLGGSGKVLKCPHCGALFHEECIQSLLELRSDCPKCKKPVFL